MMKNCIASRRVIALFVSLFLLNLTLPAQVDTSFRFYFYDQRYSLFENLPVTKGATVMLGNSITNGANWAELLENPLVINRGVSGDNTFGVLNRLDQITAMKPDKVFILLGINDLARGFPVGMILKNYRRIVETIQQQSPATRIFVQSILPTNSDFNDFKNHQNKDLQIREVNAGLKLMAVELNVVFIDLYPHFLNDQGKLSTAFTNDGLHLTGPGYLRWVEIIHPFVNQKKSTPAFGGEYYERQRAMHEAMPIVKGAVVMLGNSLTEQGLWYELFPDTKILNRGIGGDNIRGMTERLPAILANEPSKLFIMAGINNILFRDSKPEDLEAEIVAMIDLIKSQSPSTEVYIQSLLPVNEAMTRGIENIAQKKQHVREFNQTLEKMSKQHDLVFIDLFGFFADKDGSLKEYLTTDGIHLRPDAYRIWAEVLREYIF